MHPNKVAADLVRETKRADIKTKLDTVAAQAPELPVGKFDVIVVDPPVADARRSSATKDRIRSNWIIR